MLETKFLPASDERFRLIPELLEQRDGLLMGCVRSALKGGIDHAFTYGYWMNCLERNEVKRVLLGFYGSLAYGMSRGTWAGVECTNMASGANASTLPHLRSGTQQLRLLRHMLVREDGNRLVLAQAAPQHWLADGKEVAVHDAPTHFGEVSYTIHSHAGQGRIWSISTRPRENRPRPSCSTSGIRKDADSRGPDRRKTFAAVRAGNGDPGGARQADADRNPLSMTGLHEPIPELRRGGSPTPPKRLTEGLLNGSRVRSEDALPARAALHAFGLSLCAQASARRTA